MKDFHVRRGMHWMVISLFLAVAACGGDTGTNGDTGNTGNTGDTGNTGGTGGNNPTATISVMVENDFFDPEDILVSPGATVTWTWAGGAPEGHNVTFASSAVSNPSATQSTGTFEVVMPIATGEYAYQCTIHSGMDGSVTVSSSGSGGGISYNLR